MSYDLTQVYMSKGSYDFMGGSSLPYVTTVCLTVGDDRHCDSGDLMFLICHVTSPDHVLKDLGDYVWKPLTISHHHFTMLEGHLSSARGNIRYWFCNVTSQDDVTEGSYGFMDGSSSLYVTTLSSLVVIGIW